MLKPGALRLPLLLSVLLPALAGAGELYRYVNDKGVIVLDRQGVPPEYIGKGYDVLSDQGRVVRVVPPAPTAAERQRLQEEKARATSDAQLLRLYSRNRFRRLLLLPCCFDLHKSWMVRRLQLHSAMD